MNPAQNHTEARHAAAPGETRKPYTKPVLVHWGDVRGLTLGGTGLLDESGGGGTTFRTGGQQYGPLEEP